MSTPNTSAKPASGPRPDGPAPVRRGPGGGGPFGGMQGPAEKAMNFGPSAKRLIGRLAPERRMIVLVVLLGVASVVLSVLGPKILGEATTLIFKSVVTKSAID
ncbi:MAG: ABC transporter ATP-binding protein, partial [Leifsonia sp.]|nr:ABC transporter ATP-binding protein [Leifsonia sp.]